MSMSDKQVHVPMNNDRLVGRSECSVQLPHAVSHAETTLQEFDLSVAIPLNDIQGQAVSCEAAQHA